MPCRCSKCSCKDGEVTTPAAEPEVAVYPDTCARCGDTAGDSETSVCSCFEIHAYPRASYFGGQHTGTSGSGVLLIHKPSGVATVSVDERSQWSNHVKAIRHLKDILSRLGDP